MIRIRHSHLAFCTFAAILLALGSPSVGAEEADVKIAVEANHAAIHALSIADIANVWSHGADVTLVNPTDTSVAVGWDAVKDRWERVFNTVAGVDITQTEGPYVTVTGDIARSVGIAHVVVHFKSQAAKETTFVETDVFLKQNGRWFIVSHSAKPI